MFSSAYKTLLLNNLLSTNSPGNNCEEDFSKGCLTSYKTLFTTYINCEDSVEDHVPEIENYNLDCLPKNYNSNSDLTILINQTQNYISGYIVKKLNTVFFKNCRICLSEICSIVSDDHQIIRARDYQHMVAIYLNTQHQNFVY